MKNSFYALCIMLISVSISFSLEAQQTWDWDTYEVSIDLPDDFKVVKNTENEFDAVGDGMEIFMFIFESDITLDEMKDATLEVADEMRLEEVDSVEAISTRGFKGKYVAGYLEGDAVLLCGLINPKNITNFFVLVTFGDDDDVAEEDAFKILKSIRKH
ncbi:MAG: hypothetical protein AAGA77_18620 [Bacteroidota bacterium]